ncbi:Rha family transcriptional regulator [Paenibacillus odorifer]|uniref:phage antirepressor KilAC domain-containing protein n=1 Tax=Paenibacillus odorifer TaxID=189426 RepID=UPI00096FB632|nr:phage antirepressor KilAC domain-containing protein [Paenibacillus odorifer]OMD69151.1 Rha family transcriptional regulator [Paenibacillus odorifer]
MNQLRIVSKDGKLLADSREIALMTGKQHKHLVRDIDNYVQVFSQSPDLDSDDFFVETTYQAGTGKSYKMYLLTKIGCDMVANKMTGPKGILFTATYVSRFEEMERKLLNPDTPSYMIPDPVERAKKWIAEEENRQHLESKTLLLEQQISEIEPKLTYLDKILTSKGTITITQIAKDYGLSGTALNKILHEERIQYKVNKQWVLYTKYTNKGFTQSETIDITRSNGEPDVTMNTRWTQKGRLFIHEILTRRGILPFMDRESLGA